VFSFQEFSATFAIGAFALSVFAGLVYLLFGLNLLERLGILSPADGGAVGRFSLMFVAAAFFGIGMVAEDLSNRYVDSDENTPH